MSSDVVYVTKWTCDVCKVAEFNTFEEALKHEKACVGVKPKKTVAPPLKENTLDTKKEKSKEQAPKKSIAVVTKWACDFCNTARFDSFDEACKHEAQCAAKKSPTAIPESKKIPSAGAAPTKMTQPSSAMPSAVLKPAANTASLPTAASGHLPQDKEKLKLQSSQPNVPTTNLAPTVLGQPLATPTKAEKIPKANTSSAHMLVLEPLIRQSADSKLFFQLSTFHVMILQLLDLFETRRPITVASNPSYQYRIAEFRCHRCHCVFPGPWSVWRFGNQLPQIVYSHLSTSCTSYDEHIMKGFKRAEYTRLNGKVSLYDFGKAFFTENGIKDLQINPATSTSSGLELVILDEGKDWPFDTQTRRGQWMAFSDIKPKKVVSPIQPTQVSARFATIPTLGKKIPTPIKKLNSSLSGTGGILLIENSTPSNEPAVSPSPFLHLAMSQLELRPCDVTPNGALFRLALYCKHCSNHCRPTSFEHWFKSVYSLTYSHLIKSCNRIPSATRATLSAYKNDKTKTTGGTGLRVFCEYLNEVHGLVDTKVAGGKDSCPGLGIPQKQAKGLDIINKKSSTTKKHTLPEAKTCYTNNAKKPKIDQNYLERPIVTLHLSPLKRHLDEEGNCCYLPPVEGVPLISSQSRTMSSKLSRYFWMILDQLEFFDGELKNVPQPNPSKFIGLRCRNCSNDPKHRFFKKLTTLDQMSDDIITIARTHSLSCPCTPRHTVRELGSTSVYNKRNKGLISLKGYCKHLSQIYSMKELRGKGLDGKTECVLGVVWDICQLIPTGYSGQPSDPSLTKKKVPVTVSTIPVHNLMIDQPKPATVKSKKIMASTLSRIILSDYSYILVSQLEFIPVKRKILLPHKTARQRSRQQTSNDGSNSSRLSPVPSENIVAVVRCKRCFQVKNCSTIQSCAGNMATQFYTHFRKCTHFPSMLLTKLEECKVYQAMQKSPMLMNITEYIRKVMCEIYDMKDLEWNGVSGGIGFKNIDDTKKKYGDKIGNDPKMKPTANDSEEFENIGGFTLPLLVNCLAQPCTIGLLDGISKNNTQSSKESSSLVPQVQQATLSSATEKTRSSVDMPLKVGETAGSKNDIVSEKGVYQLNVAASNNVCTKSDLDNDPKANQAVDVAANNGTDSTKLLLPELANNYSGSKDISKYGPQEQNKESSRRNIEEDEVSYDKVTKQMKEDIIV